MAGERTSMLEVENLHVGYGRIPILTGVTLQVRAGEFVGVLGHNGMGKTTLLRALVGVLPITSGKVRLEGRSLEGRAPHVHVRAGMGYVQQGRGIFPGLTVKQNLAFAAAAHPLGKGNSIDEAVAQFPRLGPLLERPGGALSGGEQQLLALARALVQRPKFLMLDEPTEGIQPSIIEEIIDRLQLLRKRSGLTVLLVEQNVDFVRALSDRVLLMQRGQIAREMDVSGLSDSMGIGNFGDLDSAVDARIVDTPEAGNFDALGLRNPLISEA